MTYAEAEAAGTADETTWVDNCDPETGRIMIPSVYAPPCVPAFDGRQRRRDVAGRHRRRDHGRQLHAAARTPTSPRRSAAPRTNPTRSCRPGRTSWRCCRTCRRPTGARSSSSSSRARGPGDDAVAAQADAVNIVENLKPFAVLNGPAQTPVFAEEMARNKIICISCGLALPDSFTQEHAPYIWGIGPSAEQFLTNFTGYVQRSLLGKKAEFAGDPAMQEQERRFGVVHFEQDPPVFSALTERLNECGAEDGLQRRGDRDLRVRDRQAARAGGHGDRQDEGRGRHHGHLPR